MLTASYTPKTTSCLPSLRIDPHYFPASRNGLITRGRTPRKRIPNPTPTDVTSARLAISALHRAGTEPFRVASLRHRLRKRQTSPATRAAASNGGVGTLFPFSRPRAHRFPGDKSAVATGRYSSRARINRSG